MTYTSEANAYFAPAAVAHQSVNHEEVLDVPWTEEELYSATKVRSKDTSKSKRLTLSVIRCPKDRLYELEGQGPKAKR